MILLKFLRDFAGKVKPGWDPTLFEDERRAAVEDALKRAVGRLAEARDTGFCHVFGKVC